jgi:hypothetical protein
LFYFQNIVARRTNHAGVPMDEEIIEPSLRIKAFCRAESISKTFYYDLKKEGLGPDETNIGGIIRITHRDRLAWQDKMRNPPAEVRAKLEELKARRLAQSRRAAAASVASPNHISNPNSAAQRQRRLRARRGK